MLAPAINLSLALEKTGNESCGRRLLDAAWEQAITMPRFGLRGRQIADVEILARRGETEAALAVLREAIDAGWRSGWWLSLGRNPHIASLRAEPAFIAMVEELREDVAAQLARVRQLEAEGVLAEPRLPER